VTRALQVESPQVIALQEVSLKRLNQLQESLHVSCKHVDYHGLGGRWRGGLATCVTQDSPWAISRARDFSLGGEWRALFVELKAHNAEARFNVINVHFAPHGVGPSDLKEAVHELSEGSSKALYALITQLIQTTQRQGEQVEELMRALNTLSDPTLILGDFNAPPHTALHKAFDEASDGGWVDAWREVGVSFGATRYVGGLLPLRIDFIYALRRAFDLGSVRVGVEPCSDHQPLHLRARLKGA
jgi:endonuclease/exonuclease/phosphatase (EEP) superfamily protein YafD